MKSGFEAKANLFETLTYDQSFSGESLEEVACNVCGARERSLLFTEGPFGVQRCAECGLVYISPQPTAEALDEYYRSVYYPSDPDVYISSWRHESSFAQVRRILRKHRPGGGRLLDVGCGVGLFLKSLGQQWELAGIDPSVAACEHARRELPHAHIACAGILSEDALLSSDSFDALVTMAVLDHLKDPALAVRRMCDVLRPGGHLAIRVASFGVLLRLKSALPFLPIRAGAPRHLFDFSPATLGRLLSANGFEVEQAYVGAREQITRPLVRASVNVVKAVSRFIYFCTAGRYIPPFCGAIVVVARKK
ncbi:MAG: class I SAM-dependent methyltransferase [FCB group bacterium]|jgi:SAM-dependent methyltransferase|nr:class I SAM-dependent methyltransferase [FCB group bacterium]